MHDSRSGFALVVALSVLALVLLLFVSLSTLLRVQTKVAANSIQVLEARQNALLGMQIALARIQSSAGADLRVTGRADLLDGDASTEGAEGIAEPLWTGVWRSCRVEEGANNELDAGASPTLREWSTTNEGPIWLVSNPDPATPLDPRTWSGDSSGIDADAVVLGRSIGALGAGSEPTDVTVPLVSIGANGVSGTNQGKYAYWIEDEGIKARLNLHPGEASNLETGGNAEENRALNARHYLAPATVAAEQALSSDYRADLLDGQDDLGKLASTRSLGVVLGAAFDDDSDGYARSHPDITVWSQGLLADVRRGGLKTDLTAAFESLDQFGRLIGRPPPGRDATDGGADDALGGKLWRVPGVAAANSVYFDGPRWHALYSYYNTYKKTHPNYLANPSGIYPWWGKIPEGLGGIGGDAADMSLPVLNVSGNNRAVAAGRLIPSLMGIRMPVYFSTYNTGGSDMGVRLHYSPRLVLYNPWNIALKPSEDPGTSSNRPARLVFTSNIMTANRVRISNTTTGELLYAGRAQPESTNSNLGVANSDLDFEPGQIKIFGSDRSIEGSSTYRNYNLPDEYPLVADFDNSYNFWDVKPLDGPLSASDEIQVIFETRMDTGSGSDANSVRWLFDNQSQGQLIRNTLVENQEFTVIDNQPASSFAADPGDPPTPLAVLFMRAKGRYPENLPHIPAMGGPGALWNPFYLTKSSYFWEVEVLAGAQYNDQSEFQTDGTNSYWGAVDIGRGGGDTNVILKEIFNQPLISVGQFKNADTVFKESLIPVGNSWADPELNNPTDGDLIRLWYLRADPGLKLVAVDDAFLNNEALFDRFFFSTIPPAELPGDTVFPGKWTGFDQSRVDARERLLNPRLSYFRGDKQSPPALAELRDMDRAAAHLLVDGAFNVNSTSVPAWRALLGSLRYVDNPTDAYPVPRLISDLTTAPTADDYGSGMRVLDDNQLNALAQAVVEQVKERGPFLSMADFVNRRRAISALGERGALQAAIDASGINSAALDALGQPTDLTGPKDGDGVIVLPEMGAKMNFINGITPDVSENTATGVPGVITQADFLQALAPVLAARSDTFRIRFYGEANPSGSGRDSDRVTAVGEAVVQRTPEFIDHTDPALTDGDNLGNATPVTRVNGSSDIVSNLNASNTRFGRRFEVISFRWLDPEEI